jgi:hypothetical protein
MHSDWSDKYRRLLQNTKCQFEDFYEATKSVEVAQSQVLARIISTASMAPFGHAHRFSNIRTVSDFLAMVPPSSYEDYAPWYDNLEAHYFTHSLPITWAWSSGTERAQKKIPLTKQLIAEFNSAVSTWLYSLMLDYPQISLGPGYWIVGPVTEQDTCNDAAYFSPELWKNVAPLLVAVPKSGTRGGFKEWAFSTLITLILEPDLSWISVWSPTLLSELLESLIELRPIIIETLRTLRCNNLTSFLADETIIHLERYLASRTAIVPSQLSKLTSISDNIYRTLWPNLSLCSCWGDSWASLFLARLQRLLPGIAIQRKGLLATEGIISIPLSSSNDPTLAITSHFYEFIESTNSVPILAHQLSIGKEYEILLTTGGGLYRYALGDRVKVTGWHNQAPRLRFIGKSSFVTDLCGEKLHEGFVVSCLEKLTKELSYDLSHITLRPVIDDDRCYYVAHTHIHNKPFIEALQAGLERELSLNPHYKQCRILCQLDPLRVSILEHPPERITRLSTAKERVLLSCKE